MRRAWTVLAVAVGLGAHALAGCGGDDGESCVSVPTTCTPQYDPTFDEVYTNTLATSCALSGCHGGDGGSTGFGMGATADEAYDAVSQRVTAGDPGCSVLVDHLEPDGIGDMPPGTVLADEERCSVRTWIADGASR